jgi:hypothetical protein
MKSSFIAYVDESGDEGFVFHPDGTGSSRWFVLSAAVIRRTNDLQMVSCLKAVRSLLGREPKSPLHFVDLKHEHRVPYIRRVGELPMRTISVLVYKPLIAEPEKFQNTKYLLYRYATRLLLERVSWLVKDKRTAGEGDGFAEVIFSNRSKMSYDEIRGYLSHLLAQQKSGSSHVQIEPTAIDPARIRAVDHSQMAGLQVADAVASGLHFAVKINKFGEVEAGYLPHLKSTLYRHKASAAGYGLKLWPESFETLKAKAPEAVNLEGLLS